MANTVTAEAPQTLEAPAMPEPAGPKAGAEILFMPEVPLTDVPGQAENIFSQESPAPDLTDGSGGAPPSVSDGLFGEIPAAAKEAKEKADGQDKAAQEAPANPAAEEQAAPKKGRGGRPAKEKPGQAANKEKPEKAAEAEKPRRGGRPPKAAGDKDTRSPQEITAAIAKKAIEKHGSPEAPAEPEPPAPPKDATRPGATETVVYIAHADLHPFKNHPFQVRDDDAMKSLAASVKERGIDQPALVRPREGGGYELVAGHRRQHAAEMAGYANIPCIVRNMTDDEAILAMTESNFNQRAEILPSERALALKMQLDAIKSQGVRLEGLALADVGKRSNEIIAERNKMSVKNVQRYISLNKLVPELMAIVDAKKMKFTVAVELSYVRPKNQKYIAVAIDAQESAPSGAQAQRMRELDSKGILNADLIDGIMVEEKKEETRVILNSQELGKYFGPEKSPREMKDTILKLLDEYKEKQPPEIGKPARNKEAEK